MKKIIVFLTVIIVCTLLFSACGAKEEPVSFSVPTKVIEELPSAQPAPTAEPEETPEPIDYAEIYAPLIGEYYDFIVTGGTDEFIEDGFIGVREVMGYTEPETLLGTLGFSITDLSGDGIPELMIVNDDEWLPSTQILAVYSCVEGTPKLVFEGWARNRYHLMNDGRIYNEGSNGAAYSIFGIYELAEDGTKLLCSDYYFTYEKDETFTEIGIYHNTTGEWDKAVSEELRLMPEEFYNMQTDYLAETCKIEFTPFSEYR